MTATVWARTTEIGPVKSIPATLAAARARRRRGNMVVMIIVAISTIGVVETGPIRNQTAPTSGGAALLNSSAGSRRGCGSECPQADLEHIGMAENGRGPRVSVAVRRHVICRQH